MPQSYTALSKREVIEGLRAKGYGIDSCQGYAFRLATRTGPARKLDKLKELVPIGGIRDHDLNRILYEARDKVQAISMVEKICKGEALNADDALPPAPGGVDMAAL